MVYMGSDVLSLKKADKLNHSLTHLEIHMTPYIHSGVSMVVADYLAPIWCQYICNHHVCRPVAMLQWSQNNITFIICNIMLYRTTWYWKYSRFFFTIFFFTKIHLKTLQWLRQEIDHTCSLHSQKSMHILPSWVSNVKLFYRTLTISNQALALLHVMACLQGSYGFLLG